MAAPYWTPIDASGAGLALTVLSARFSRTRHTVHVSADILYPTTTNALPALLGGLPFTTVAAQSGLALGYQQVTTNLTLLVRASNTVILPVLTPTGAVVTNAQLSGKNLVFSGTYEAVPLPTLLSGQSNADNVASALTTLRPVTNISQGSTAIAAWAVGGAQWARVAPVLVDPLDAFVWWQGESDLADLSNYAVNLADVIARVRVTQPEHMHVVICGANDYTGQQPLRDIQIAYAAAHADTTYVPSDDLPSVTGSQHLTTAGYVTMAGRVATAIIAAERRFW